MSTNGNGIAPAPIATGNGGTFPTAAIPTPIPSSGILPNGGAAMNMGNGAGVTNPMNGGRNMPGNGNPMMNQIMDAAAGPKCNIIWKKSVDEILAYPTSPKEQLYFILEEEPVIYVRETDASGAIKNPLTALHYTVEEVPFGQEARFVTKDEHRQLYELVERLAGNVDSMNGKLEKLLNG